MSRRVAHRVLYVVDSLGLGGAERGLVLTLRHLDPERVRPEVAMLWDPDINYAKMAQAYGMEGFGPITDPKDLAPTFRKAIELVKKGEPAMIDVVTQPR